MSKFILRWVTVSSLLLSPVMAVHAATPLFPPEVAQRMNPSPDGQDGYMQPVYVLPLRDQCFSLSIAFRFCTRWVQEVVNYRRQWGYKDLPPDQLVARLEPLNSTSRKRLGSYRNEDYRRQNDRLKHLGISHEEMDDRTDEQFYRMFPEHRSRIIPGEKMTRQVWFAIRESEVRRLEQRYGGRLQPQWH